nr:hypothetical protein [Tanacetum cinerariifolium]
LNAEQADRKDDTDDESDDQELEAHYMYMAKIQEVSPTAVNSGPIFDTEPEQKVKNDDHYDVFAIEYQHPEQSESVHETYLIEQDAHNVLIESVDINSNSEQLDHNDEDADLAKERELLASLIEKLKCEIDESKNRNKFLETSNKVLINNLKNEIKDLKNENNSLELSNNQFKEANNKLSEQNDLLYADFKKSQAELKRRDSIEYALEMELECAKVRGDFLSYKMEYQKSCNKYTQTINDLNQMISKMKNKLSAHQDTISIPKQQKDARIKLYKTREDKELEKVIELENKVKVLDNILYKTGQSVQTMNMLNNKCRTSFVKPEYLKKAKQVNPRLDGENLDKMKEKGNECIFVGYSNQLKAYRVFNKITRVIMESIHVNFDELPLMASDQNSSDPAPECQTMALNHDSLSPIIQRQGKVTQADRTVTTSNELDLLFSPMFDELLNGSSKDVSKSSAVFVADAPNQRQQLTTPLTNHTTPAPTCQILTSAPTVISPENINQAETHAENDQVADDEFINIFSTPVQDQGETSSRHVDSSNMHTFYQRYPSEHRWTKDHPLEQVIGNPSQPVRTRRQLESDAEMCMFALTVSQTEPINIKEAMADSAWIELMQEELH